jgi:hypothetical protein
MRFTALAIASALALTYSAPAANVVPGDVPFTLCSDWVSKIKVKSLKFDPNPPTIKKPFTVIANGDLQDITIHKGAKLVIVATLGSMEVHKQEVDICDEAAKSGLNCPITPGNHDLRNQVPVPEGIQIPPFVGIKVNAKAYGHDGSKLFCLDATVKFKPS